MNWFLNILDHNVIEREIKREKVQMKPPNYWLQNLFFVTLNWINQPTHSNFFFSETNPACYVQTCEQFIIGRDLTYKEALHIVQNEKYLSVADIERVVLLSMRANYNFINYRKVASTNTD